MKIEDVISAVRRSNRAWWEQVCQSESLEFGVACTAAEYPSLVEGNQLSEAWIADADPELVYEKAEAYFRDRGLTCRVWTPASSQPPEPVDSLLLRHGWRRSDLVALGLVSWDAQTVTPADGGEQSVRILPARAMRRAYRSLLAESFADDESRIEAAFARLDDANFDAVIAQVDGEPAGRVAYLEVGDIAALTDLHVASVFKGRRIESELIAHFLQTARRLSPRQIVACVESSDAASLQILESHGFAAAGTLPRWLRNTD